MGLNLSIFNFKPLRALVALPLRRHLWHGTVLAVMIGVMLGASWLLGQTDKTAHKKLKDLSPLREAAVLILGDSQFAGLSQSEFILPTLNMAQGATTFQIHEVILRYDAPRMPKLKTVLLELDDLVLRKDGVAERKGDYRDYVQVLGLPWFALPTPFFDKVIYAVHYQSIISPLFCGSKYDLHSFEAWFDTVKAASMMVYPEPPERNVFCNVATFGSRIVEGRAKMNYYSRIYSGEYLRGNLSALFAIIEYCDAHDLNLVFVRPNTTSAFYGSRPSSWNEELLALLSQCRLRTKQPLPVWDIRQYEVFSLEYFNDPNHLSDEGCSKFVGWLNERLAQWPYADDAGGLFKKDPANLLASQDPREDIWQGLDLAAKSGTMRLAQVPSAFIDRIEGYACRMELPPGGKILQKAGQVVRKGDAFTAAVWLWTDAPSADLKMRLSICRADTAQPESGSTMIASLTGTPTEVTCKYIFKADHADVCFQLENNMNKPIVLYFAAPTLGRL